MDTFMLKTMARTPMLMLMTLIMVMMVILLTMRTLMRMMLITLSMVVRLVLKIGLDGCKGFSCLDVRYHAIDTRRLDAYLHRKGSVHFGGCAKSCSHKWADPNTLIEAMNEYDH